MGMQKKVVTISTVIIIFCCLLLYKVKTTVETVATNQKISATNSVDAFKKSATPIAVVKHLQHNKQLVHKPKTALETQREKYAAFLNNYPYNKKDHAIKEADDDNDEDGENETDHPELAWEQDFLRTMNPALGRPTPEVLPAIIQQNHAMLNSRNTTLDIPGSNTAAWVERGPNNVGGRTRALVFDPNDVTHKKVWAGGVTGGLWYNNDITDASATWNKVNDLWSNIAVTCIAFDPNNPLKAYVGTGEGWQAGSTVGAGIWKTTDGGSTWTQISNTSVFNFVNSIVVRNESGTSVIYAAIDANSYQGTWKGLGYEGLRRSTNEGANWAQVLPIIPGNTGGNAAATFNVASISIAADNRIWVGTKASPYSNTDRGGGKVLYSDDGTTWTISKSVTVTNGTGRVSVATAPSNANTVYAFVEDNSTVGAIIKTTDKGANWVNVSEPDAADNTIPSTDFSRGQAWYDQAIQVDPNDANTVITGASDLFRTTDGGTTWLQISKWSNNNQMASKAYSTVHADQHAITFMPGSSSTVIFGNDGGIFFTSSVSTASTSNVISVRNTGYNITQFYAAAMHPGIASDSYLAGAQDNGTQKFSASGINTTTSASGGDGAYCFIDQLDPTYQISSYVQNQYYFSRNTGSGFFTNVNGSAVLDDATTGSFINPAYYDNNKHILYTYKSKTSNTVSLYRVSGVTTTPLTETITLSSVTSSSNVTAFKVSPYTLNSTTLFVGLSTGKLLKVSSADASTTPAFTDITGTLPVGSISCIEIGRNENELLVTFFNYGISKVWYTADGGTNWVDKSGNFPNIPARWALFNPNNRTDQVILATELGIYSTSNFSGTPSWSQSNNGFANVRTDMLQLRNSDYQVIAATHGRGLYSSNAFSAAAAPTITSFTPAAGISGATITITGTNFTGATAVSFGGSQATYTVVNATTITAVVGSGTNGYVSVTTPGGVATIAGFYSTATWTGTTSTNWSVSTNWDINQVPINNVNIIIPNTANKPIIASVTSVTVNNLTINSGASLTISGKLTPSGVVTNNGTLIVAPNGAFIGSSTNLTGNITLQQNVVGQRGWRVIANPFITAQTLSSIASNNGITIGTSAAVTDTRLYSNSGNSWTNNTSDIAANSLFALFIRGLSSEVTGNNYTSGPSGFVFSLTGTLNSSPVSRSQLIAYPFRAISNPYAAPVTTQALTGGLSKPYYTYQISVTGTPTIKSGSWVASGANSSTTTAIPVLGVLAYTPSSDGNFNVSTSDINTSAMVQTGLLGIASPFQQLELVMETKGDYADKLFIRQDATATVNGKDNNDLQKFNNDITNLYTTTPDGLHMAIDARSEFVTTIPLGVSSSEGTYNFRVNSNTLPSGTTVYLKDKLLNIQTELKVGASYDFSITTDTTTQGEKRFELLFTKPSSSLTTIESSASGLQMKVLGNVVSGNVLSVQVNGLKAEEAGSLSVIDMSGRVIATKSVANGLNTINISNASKGMQLIQLSNSKDQLTQKFIKE
jgi:hypothetical protein